MNNIIYIAGLQLSLVVKVVFQNGPSKSLPLLFGPFRTERDLKEWKEAFLDVFPQYCRQLPGVENCFKSSEEIEDYEADNPETVEPINPLILAEELLNLYFEDETYLEEGSNLPLRYFEWSATLQFDIPDQGSFTVDRTYAPINDVRAFKMWWRRFKKGVRKRTLQLRKIRFRVLSGEFIELEEFPEEEQEGDFFEITCWDPEILAQEFLTHVLRDWMQKKSRLQKYAKAAVIRFQN